MGDHRPDAGGLPDALGRWAGFDPEPLRGAFLVERPACLVPERVGPDAWDISVLLAERQRVLARRVRSRVCLLAKSGE